VFAVAADVPDVPVLLTQLSPNGKHLAYVKPSADGVMNVFIKQLPGAAAGLKLKRDVSLFDQEGTAGDKQVMSCCLFQPMAAYATSSSSLQHC
jgi:hypothetical protein